MKDKLDWLWNNIMSIYLDKGVDFRCKVNGLLIISNDNYFECVIENDYNFKISIEYSFNGEPKIYFNPYNDGNQDNISEFYIDKLKPIFRDYKIKQII